MFKCVFRYYCLHTYESRETEKSDQVTIWAYLIIWPSSNWPNYRIITVFLPKNSGNLPKTLSTVWICNVKRNEPGFVGFSFQFDNLEQVRFYFYCVQGVPSEKTVCVVNKLKNRKLILGVTGKETEKNLLFYL